MKKMYSKVLRQIVSKISNLIPRRYMNIVSPKLRGAVLDLIIYFDSSSLISMFKADSFEDHDDVYQPSVPVDWIKELYDFRLIEKESKILVLLHAFYLELLPEIIGQLSNIHENFDLVITCSANFDLKIDEAELPIFCKKYLVLRSANRGRDIGPMVGIINSNILEDYELVLKVHTKKSAWRDSHDFFTNSGSEWRKSFLQELIGSPIGTNKIIKSFREDRNLGLVTSRKQILDSTFWGKNRQRTTDLAQKLFIEQYIDDLTFPAGSMYWCRPIILSSISPLDLNLNYFEPEAGQNDGTLAHAIERLIGLIVIAYGFKQIEVDQVEIISSDMNLKPKVIAYYLPQFYPFPENDLQWGNGFTEWSNVARSKPQFEGHVQPVLPEGLGFYDLRIEENVLSQEELAASHGISSFCYYYYNFGDHEIMSDLLQKRLMRRSGLSFNILWVNESWSRAWDGSDNLVTQMQSYPDGWETEFFFSVLPYLKHPDYTVSSQGYPVIGIYRPLDVPELNYVLDTWRELACKNGLPGLFIVGVRAPKNFGGVNLNFREYGLDATQDFAPHGIDWVKDVNSVKSKSFRGQIFSMRKTFESYGPSMGVPHGVNQFPGLMVGFDNTPRRGSHSYLISDSNPFTFRKWLLHSINIATSINSENPFVYVNAWNEWAETSMLEPNSKWKNLYLQVIRQLVS
jgi:hypothetical protein